MSVIFLQILRTRFLQCKKVMCYNNIALRDKIVWILIQYLKRQKNTLKKVNVRIFRQLPAKMSLGSLDFSGLWEHSVEMKDTRLRELLPLLIQVPPIICERRNEGYPIKGIATNP